jgi:hypothetical protein
VLNESYHWFAALTENAAGVRPSIRVENWPPMVPIRELRPTDRRNMSTFDFFPMAGEDISLALITSYFREPARFPLLFDVPAGKQITAMRELLENRSVDFSCDGGTARIDVQLGFDTPVKLYLFETGPSEK